MKDVPWMHATGEHSKCSSKWCNAKKAAENGKPYHRNPMFSYPDDAREIKQVQEIFEK